MFISQQHQEGKSAYYFAAPNAQCHFPRARISGEGVLVLKC